MKRWRFLSIAITVLALVLIILPSQIASAEEICGRWDTVPVMGGEYTIMNNVWGATTTQCINVPSISSNAFSVTRADHDQGSVASYPAVYKGCHWDDCTSNSGMPIRVSELNTAPFTWDTTRISSGGWNIAAEGWFSPIPDSTDGYNGGAELMIWLDYMGMQPAGSRVGTASIGGASWEVWYANIGWNYIAYRRIGAVSSINADLKTFIDDAISRGYIQHSWYLHAFEAGTELMTGGTGFASNSFTFTVNGGTPPTSTPVTVIPPTSTPVTVVPPTSTPSSGGLYQAENAALGGGVSVDTNHSGYYGTGFVNFPSSGGYVEYRNIDGGSGGNRTLRFRHALGATSSRTGQLTINGAGQNITFSPTGSWDSWAILEVSTNLNAGASNTIRLQSNGQDLANQDQMEVVGGTMPPTSTPVTVFPPTSTPVTVFPPTSTPVTVIPPTSTPVTVVPPTSTPVQGVCSVNYVIQNDWGSGATVNVTIRNNGPSAINGWTLCWTFPGSQQIANLWNGSYTQSGVSICVSDAGWNATIPPNGGTAGFGFNLSYSGSNEEPTNFTLNGAACQAE